MTSPTASPYATLPQVNQVAVLPAAQQAPQPQPASSAAQRRSFKSFVEAMDDFGFDRRDVAGMRQALAMQEDMQRARAAQAAAPAATSLKSFAPGPAEPEIPVVRGLPLNAPAAAAAPGDGGLPRLPSFAAGPSADLPRLPAHGGPHGGAPTITGNLPASELPRLQPSSGKAVAYMSFAPQPQNIPAPVPVPAAPSNLPPQLQSPLVDQIRDTTRAGQRPGLSDDMRARFAANGDRRRMFSAPVPPKLMAQEARWNRDAWPATVTAQRAAAPPAATGSAPQQTATDLPRLPTLPTAQ